MIYDLSTLYDREFSEGSLETAALIAIAERLDALIEAGGNYRLIDSISGLSSQLCEINQRQTNVTNLLHRIVGVIDEHLGALVEAVEKAGKPDLVMLTSVRNGNEFDWSVKDTSKAQWPEGMAVQAWSDDATVIGTKDFKDVAEVYGTREQMKFRAAQICALPEMVALLKEGAEQKTMSPMKLGGVSTFETTPYALKCKALLKQIGEAE